MGLAHDFVVTTMRKRFDIASQKILESPKFDENTRDKTARQLATFIVVLDQSLEAAGGFTLDHYPVINPIVKFLDLIDEFCDSKIEPAQMLA